MSDVQTMKDMITGLKQKKRNLQADEAVFLKLSGINEQIEQAGQDRDQYQTNLAEAKKKRDDAKRKKSAAVSETISKIEEKVNEVLPYGKAVFSYSSDENDKYNMVIGWHTSEIIEDGPVTANVINKTTPYNVLSGAEKQMFDAALANVLNADIIVVEAAELDPENLENTLAELSKLDKQEIVNTCHKIDFPIPENFKMIEV